MAQARRRRFKPIIKHSRRRKLKVRGMGFGGHGSLSASDSVIRELLEPDGRVAVDRAAGELRMSKADLAETVGLAPETLQRSARVEAPKTQARLREMLEIVTRVSPWAGGPVQAVAWYRAEPIPAFGGRTAESLVKEGKAAAVRDYLDGVALGSFA
jgi:DNA-binding TFAR19-related protein (PDSD5 family)